MGERSNQRLYSELLDLLKEMGSAVIAFSGGTDSTLLAKAAYDALGDRTLALTIDSPSLALRERTDALDLAEFIGISHVVLPGKEMQDENYLQNNSDRCYFCKFNNYNSIVDYSGARGYKFVIDGHNADDSSDHRPGHRAARELGIRSPLRELGITKSMVRKIGRDLGLPNADKPASACLASRIPYGTRVTAEKLSAIDKSEEFLLSLGITQCRVRHHGTVARIEVLPGEMGLVMENREQINDALTKQGFLYVSLDMAGFSSGSMNRVLQKKELNA